MPVKTSRSRVALAVTTIALAASALTGCGAIENARAAEACEMWQDEVWAAAAHSEGGFDVANAAHAAKFAQRPEGCVDDWHIGAAKSELCDLWSDLAYDSTIDIERAVPADQVEATNATIAAALEAVRVKRPEGCEDNWKTDVAAKPAYAEKEYVEATDETPPADVVVPGPGDSDSPINAGCGWSWRGGFGCGVGIG